MTPATALTAPRGLRVAVAAWGGAVLLVGALIAALLLVPRRAPEPRSSQRVAVVAAGAVAGMLLVPGQLEAKTTVRVGALAPGQVVAVHVAVGDRVARGQILARMDDLEQRRKVDIEGSQLGMAELRGIQAEKRFFELVRSLQGDNFVPEDIGVDHLMAGDLGDAQLALLATSSQISAQRKVLSLARALLDRRVVRAPMAGVVLEKGVESGETVSASPPGPPLFVIGSDPAALVLRVELDEGHASNLQPGDVSFRVRGLTTRSFRGTVRPASLASAPGGPRRHEIAVDVSNADDALRPGLRAVVAFPMSSERHALRVPLAAVTRDVDEVSRGTVSFVDRAGQVLVTSVAIGVANAEVAEVRGAGLAPGVRVLVPR
jgi:HlyD family secretion protein